MAQLIGSGANQVPVNGMLGTAAFVDKEQLPVSEPQQVALNLKANLASPALTGTPTAPTAAVGTNTTQLATTAFVNAEIANDAPTKTGGGATGTWPISVTGNAATATKLATARTINGVSFDGSANISINAAAVPNTPAGSIASTTVQAALNELGAEKVSNVVVFPSTTNLDTAVTSGFYRMDTVSNGPPISVDYGQLIVSRGLDTITQIAVAYGSGRMFTRSGNPASVGGAGAFTPWREVYTSGSIIGTVSQSAGVPTGAIIERGSNANGEYVRYADGTQICWWSKSLTYISANELLATATLPAVFIADPRVSALLFGSTLGMSRQHSIMCWGGGTGTASLALLSTGQFTAADATVGYLSAIAIGRWF